MKLKSINNNTQPIGYSPMSNNFETGIVPLKNLDLNIKSCSDDASNEAESVDSGCVPDLTPENSWLQVSSTLKYEYSFISELLQQTLPKSTSSNELDSEMYVPTSSKLIRTSDVEKLMKKEKIKQEMKALEDAKRKEESTSKGNETELQATNYDVDQKNTLESELRRLKSGKLGNLSKSQAKTREKKIKKQLLIMEKQRKKGSKISKAQNRVAKEKNDGKRNNLQDSEAKSQETKIKNQLTLMEKQPKKGLNEKIKAQNEMTEKQDVKTEEAKLKKHLTVMERQHKIGLKKMIKEENEVIKGENENQQNQESKKIYNNSGRLVFSKFDFSECVKEKWEDPKSSNLKSYMKKIIEEKEMIQSLEAQGKTSDAVTHLERSTWDKAMKRAGGEKVKDDVQKLKKTLNRKKYQRRKSQKQWAERIENVKKSQEERQEKRKQNLALRKERRNLKKGKMKKGGRG